MMPGVRSIAIISVRTTILTSYKKIGVEPPAAQFS